MSNRRIEAIYSVRDQRSGAVSYMTTERIVYVMESFLSTLRSGVPSSITLTHESREVEMNVSQVTASAIALIFNLNPDTVWLQETIGSRIYISNECGSFDLDTSAIAYGVRVNGVPATTPKSQQQVSPNGGSTTVITPVTASHGRPMFHSVSSRKTGTRVKVVRAHLSYAHNGRPVFNNVDVIFVDVHEDNADVPTMLRSVREQFGPDYVIVSNDGLEIKDGPGTRGT